MGLNTHSPKMLLSMSISLFAAGVVLPVHAEESGHWNAKAVLVVTDHMEKTVGDRSGHKISIYEFDGVAFNSDGQPFLDKARYQVTDLADTGAINGGYKTFTESDGSKVFAKYTLKERKPPELRGVFEFTGGTGKYEGITGNGTYHVVWVSDTALWDELSGDYKLPSAAVAGSSSPPASGMAPGSTPTK